MAEGLAHPESGSTKSLYPALAVAAIAGLTLTYWFFRKRSAGDVPVEKVVNICNTAADKLEALLGRAIA